MSLRRQLPVSSPVTLPGLLRGLGGAVGADVGSLVASELRSRFGVVAVTLCDSGTSALVLAIRAAVPRGGTVAFPSYGCVDLAAAALFSGVQVRLYDLDPTTLAADLESLERTLQRGVDAVVAVHLYGYPADVPAMKTLAHAYGAALIEDAAQGAASRIHGQAVGALGDLSILSFGRGKGTTGGRGGAVLAADAEWSDRLEPHLGTVKRTGPSGWGDLTRTAAHWLLGRPSLYALPAAIPGLRLGEMVYHAAHEPAPMSRAASSLVRSALRLEAREVASRRRNAAFLEQAAAGASGITPIRPLPGSFAGYLRFAVLDSGRRLPAPALGVARGYPRASFDQPELRPQLHADESEPLGGRHLRDSLFTLPVHGLVTTSDLARLRRWLDVPATR